MYDLLIKGGKMIDPANGIRGQRDIGISNGKVETVAISIESGEAKRVISARNMIVAPGLIDLHAHVFGGLKSGGVDPDKAGVLSGVTTICDGGSFGYINFPGFKNFVISQARTQLFCFLHTADTGIAVNPEIWCWRNIHAEAMLETIAENRDINKGIKLRAIEDVITSLGIEAVKRTKKIAADAGLPVMIHIGLNVADAVPSDKMDAFTRELLSLLDKGDILTHVFTQKTGGVIKPDGSVFPELRDALGRGVVLDVAEDRFNWSFEIARKAMGLGILPNTISTDINGKNINGPVFNLTVTMSKFLALGYSLEQIIEMTTIGPARALREEHRRGSLGIGMPADISILEVVEGDYVYSGGVPGMTFKGKLLLVPRLTIKSGVEIRCEPRFENTRPGYGLPG